MIHKLWKTFFLVGLLLPLASMAGSHEHAVMFRVVNVAAGDTLNIRQKPDVKSVVVGDIKPGEVVRVTGATAKDAAGRFWIRIGHHGMFGWVNEYFLQRVDTSGSSDSPSVSDAMAFDLHRHLDTQPLSCHGTEPFWALNIAKGQVTYADPVIDKLLWEKTQVTPTTNSGGVLWLDSRSATKPRLEMLLLITNNCSDYMSEETYPIAIGGYVGERLLSGCCVVDK